MYNKSAIIKISNIWKEKQKTFVELILINKTEDSPW